MTARPKLGLALGAGGARGLAHIGVLRVLQEAGIKFDYIAGSSMGAIIAALFQCGYKCDYMEALIEQLVKVHWKDITLRGLGFIKGDRFEEMLRLLTAGRHFADLNVPFAVVATDLAKGQKLVIQEGPLYKALRASASIPGFFAPIQDEQGRWLVDGAVTERVPVQTVKELGADFVIAIDVKFYNSNIRINNVFDVVLQSIEVLEKEVAKCSLSEADILIKPSLDGVGTTQFDKLEMCVAEGERAAREALPQIMSRLA